MSLILTVNGRERTLQRAATVAELLEELEIQAPRVAVEHNRRILRRKAFTETRLAPGDHVEIVTFVGGG